MAENLFRAPSIVLAAGSPTCNPLVARAVEKPTTHPPARPPARPPTRRLGMFSERIGQEFEHALEIGSARANRNLHRQPANIVRELASRSLPRDLTNSVSKFCSGGAREACANSLFRNALRRQLAQNKCMFLGMRRLPRISLNPLAGVWTAEFRPQPARWLKSANAAGRTESASQPPAGWSAS